jgi:YHS domain-containing protein
MSTDPVCGMTVDEKAAPASTKYAGKTIYFCSKECKDQFNQNPEAYAAETAKTT